MRTRGLRLALCTVLLVILIGSVFYSEQLRCLFVPCRHVISIKGPDQYGDILPGMSAINKFLMHISSFLINQIKIVKLCAFFSQFS